jgi:hypothetical protein
MDFHLVSRIASGKLFKIAAHSFRYTTFAGLIAPAPDADRRPQL